MSDDWDESSEVVWNVDTNGGGHDGGKSFGGVGRGFSPFPTNDDSNSYSDGRGGGRSRGDGRGRGRGRGGGRGGGRGSRDGGGGFSSNNYGDDDANGCNAEDNGFGRERRGGFRGGRGGGGRGGRDGGGDNMEGASGEPEKKKESYIPPEPTENEDEMFGSTITSGINFSKYDSIEVSVTGENAPPKIKDFDSAGFRPIILSNIKKSGYKVPTPIQKAAIPIIMADRDLMACAQTGSGKTAAFLLPIINNLLNDPQDMIIGEGGCAEPQVVIISPTRELTIQIFSEARKFAHESILKVCIAYGGTVSRHQGDVISRGCHILVATPGRLFDMVERRRLNFASVRFVVLDEADRMLDMGFIKDVEKLMSHPTMRPKEERRTLMFSATFPEEVQRLAHQFLANFIFVSVGIVGGACSDVEQSFYEVTKYKKKEKLIELLQENSGIRSMVFVGTKRNADFLAICLSQLNILTTSIHGDRLQSEREAALNDFKTGRCPVLVATAVASRGLDIKDVNHVINYDMPQSIDEYVHRIGRTGRVGNKGKATSFFDSTSDNVLANDLVKILKQAGQPVPDFLENASTGGGMYSQNRFGGEDIRTFDNAPSAAWPEEDEAW